VKKWILISVMCAVALSPSFVFAANSFRDGIWRVGKDIGAGTYRSRGGDGCYWARLRSFSGNLNAIIANANPSGPTVVTLKSTDKGFETSNCANWSRRLKRITGSKTRFGEGTFIVGLDIAPGTYRSRSGSSCYWARLRNFSGELGGIIANGNPRGPTVVTISSTDRGFDSSRCGTWSRL
jgi:hypothetical protein